MIIGFWAWISAIVAMAVTLVIVMFAAVVAWNIFWGKIDLTDLLSEPADSSAQHLAQMTRGDGDPGTDKPQTSKASLARFQFLIFTFVIAGVYLVLCLEAGTFVDIPSNVILLLGVSSTSYAASKGIKAAADSKVAAQTNIGADAVAKESGRPVRRTRSAPDPRA